MPKEMQPEASPGAQGPQVSEEVQVLLRSWSQANEEEEEEEQQQQERRPSQSKELSIIE